MLDLVLLVFGSVGAQEPAPTPPVAPQPAVVAPTIECARCAGKKSALEDCLACDGEGKIACSFCSFIGPAQWRVPRDENLTAEHIEQIKTLKQESAKLREQWDKLFGTAGPGRINCPATMAHLGKRPGAESGCRYCSDRAGFECPQCKSKASVKCAPCAGKGRVLRQCEACLGSARTPDATLIAAADRKTCPWCLGVSARKCSECVNGMSEQLCRQCAGEKTIACRECLGTRRKPCNKCYATGKLTLFLGPKTSNDCDQCKTKGSLDCDKCKRSGKVGCTVCEGRGRAQSACLACGKDGVRPCAGCFLGAYAAWEYAATVCERAGDPEAAVAWLELAVTRADAYFELQLRGIATTEAEAEAARKDRAREQQRLKQRIAVVRDAKKR